MPSFAFSTFFLVIVNVLFIGSIRTNAQIKPDSTLGTEKSIVTPNQIIKGVQSEVISGGAVRGTNLFHSFQDFNVTSSRGAYFINPSGISNILTRVTGNSPSNILGLLGVLGNANLFFLNPNGILFGPNARLDLNGSFLGTTATSIKLSDNTFLSARNPQSVPLLTIGVPIGLQFGDNPGSITVQGNGNDLSISSTFSPVTGAGQSLTGLRLKPSETLALVGGEVNFQGGIATVPSGRIKILSVDSGQISINSSIQGWILGYEGATGLRNINMSKLSLADISGFNGGDIELVAKNIEFSDGSFLLNQDQGSSLAGNINVSASESLKVTGTSSEFFSRNASIIRSRSGIISENFFGPGANIRVSTQRLLLQDGGLIKVSTFGNGTSGNISINASKSIQVSGFSSLAPAASFSGIGTSSFGSGVAGSINIITTRLFVLHGAVITSTVFGNGVGGDLSLNVPDSIEVSGENPITLLPSFVSTTTFSSKNGGNLKIATSRLILQDHGAIDSATGGTGAAGSIDIKASNFINMSGRAGLDSNSSPPNKALQLLYGVPLVASGAAGNIEISTDQLLLNNSAIHVETTSSTSGGNISLKAKNLFSGNNSSITANAIGSGNGGNITINTSILAALGNSPIAANAVEGRGGNIAINAQGIFRSPDSAITASSRLGINGTVRINTLDVSRSLEVAVLPVVPVDYTKLIAPGCPANARGNKFVVTGSGGLPHSPSDTVSSDNSTIEDWGTAQGQVNRASSAVSSNLNDSGPDEFVKATGWITDSKGHVVSLVAQAPTYTPDVPWLKSPSCHAQ